MFKENDIDKNSIKYWCLFCDNKTKKAVEKTNKYLKSEDKTDKTIKTMIAQDINFLYNENDEKTADSNAEKNDKFDKKQINEADNIPTDLKNAIDKRYNVATKNLKTGKDKTEIDVAICQLPFQKQQAMNILDKNKGKISKQQYNIAKQYIDTTFSNVNGEFYNPADPSHDMHKGKPCQTIIITDKKNNTIYKTFLPKDLNVTDELKNKIASQMFDSAENNYKDIKLNGKTYDFEQTTFKNPDIVDGFNEIYKLNAENSFYNIDNEGDVTMSKSLTDYNNNITELKKYMNTPNQDTWYGKYLKISPSEFENSMKWAFGGDVTEIKGDQLVTKNGFGYGLVDAACDLATVATVVCSLGAGTPAAASINTAKIGLKSTVKHAMKKATVKTVGKKMARNIFKSKFINMSAKATASLAKVKAGEKIAEKAIAKTIDYFQKIKLDKKIDIFNNSVSAAASSFPMTEVTLGLLAAVIYSISKSKSEWKYAVNENDAMIENNSQIIAKCKFNLKDGTKCRCVFSMNDNKWHLFANDIEMSENDAKTFIEKFDIGRKFSKECKSKFENILQHKTKFLTAIKTIKNEKMQTLFESFDKNWSTIKNNF